MVGNLHWGGYHTGLLLLQQPHDPVSILPPLVQFQRVDSGSPVALKQTLLLEVTARHVVYRLLRGSRLESLHGDAHLVGLSGIYKRQDFFISPCKRFVLLPIIEIFNDLSDPDYYYSVVYLRADCFNFLVS